MKTILSWSSGKDSAWALYLLQQDPQIELVGLLTSLNEVAGRVSMHGVSRELLTMQAAAAGLPLFEVMLPYPCSNEIYEQRMGAFIEEARASGVEAVAFGDLYLEDIRAYREDRLKDTGLKPLFPLWELGTDEFGTRKLAHAMIDAGLKARLVCLDPKQMPETLIGRDFDEELLAELPLGIDPCGENGEFHSFAYAGPMFSGPIDIESHGHVERDGFLFHDLRPAKIPAKI